MIEDVSPDYLGRLLADLDHDGHPAFHASANAGQSNAIFITKEIAARPFRALMEDEIPMERLPWRHDECFPEISTEEVSWCCALDKRGQSACLAVSPWASHQLSGSFEGLMINGLFFLSTEELSQVNAKRIAP